MSAVDRYNASKRNLTVNFEPITRRRCSLCSKIPSYLREILSRFSFQSLRSALYMAANNDFSKRFLSAWKPGSFITDFPTPAGTLYLTADPFIMNKVLSQYRKSFVGQFFESENTNLFVAGILNEMFPKEIAQIGIERVADMFILTTSMDHVAQLREPYNQFIGASSIEQNVNALIDVANNMLFQLSEQEKNECDAANLSFEFATTTISQLFTHFGNSREDYQNIAYALNVISKRMAKKVLSKPLTQPEKTEYDWAIRKILDLLNQCLSKPSPFVRGLKDSGMSDFQVKVFLFGLYFAGTETTASILNYLLWQLGRKENLSLQQEARNPETGAKVIERCVAEAFRLHPPAFIIGRCMREDFLLQVRDKFAGNIVFQKELRKGHNLLCLPQAAALDPELYPNPHQFNPNRFKDPQLPNLSFFPFAGGPHLCPGRYLAKTELMALTACLLSHFSIETLSPETQTQKGTFTLRALPAKIRLKPLQRQERKVD